MEKKALQRENEEKKEKWQKTWEKEKIHPMIRSLGGLVGLIGDQYLDMFLERFFGTALVL